jgi:hypothetical protein
VAAGCSRGKCGAAKNWLGDESGVIFPGIDFSLLLAATFPPELVFVYTACCAFFLSPARVSDVFWEKHFSGTNLIWFRKGIGFYEAT